MEWFYIAPYAGVALALLRPLAGHFAWTFLANSREGRTSPDGAQWFGALIVATLLSTAWPLVAIWIASGAYLPKVGNERQAVVRQQRKRIAELEEELSLGESG